MNTVGADLQMVSLGLLLARTIVGLLMAAHGAQKLFGWFGGYGLRATGEFMIQLGFQPGRTFAAAAAMGELAGGLLLALGFLGPIGPALMLSVMIVAAVTVHWRHGLFATSNGIELPLVYGAVALGLAMTGFGAYSLDALLGLAGRWPTGLTWLVVLGGVVGALGSLAFRRTLKPAPRA